MRIAVLHWHTSSVGGINTTLENFRAVAADRGDVFHVLASDNQRTKRPHLLPTPKRVRGGDSFIMIDGYAPHHEKNYRESAALLSDYDVILTSFLCPHPTKAYGNDPVFLALLGRLKALKKPIIGYVHDAYWDSYSDWGTKTATLCEKIVVCQAAYAEPILKLKKKVIVAYPPFYPIEFPDYGAERNEDKVLWIPQWKNIKGIHKFFKGIPQLIKDGFEVDMYNNGIEYYKLRLTPEWKKTVGTDAFAPQYNGRGRARFFGCLPLTDVFRAISTAGFVCDFQGHAAKYKAYLNGSYNHTLAETLYYGAVPVVHSNILKSGIPPELVCVVDDIADYPNAIASFRDTEKRRKAAKKYVMNNFSAEALYGKIFGN